MPSPLIAEIWCVYKFTGIKTQETPSGSREARYFFGSHGGGPPDGNGGADKKDRLPAGGMSFDKGKLMKTTLGVALLVIGILMLIYGGFSYTKREKVVDAGPVHISADKQKTVNWPPYAGGLLVIGGIVLLATGSKRNS